MHPMEAIKCASKVRMRLSNCFVCLQVSINEKQSLVETNRRMRLSIECDITNYI